MKKELEFVREVAEEIDKVGGKVYFVGGYVRDKFLNKSNKDIDVEIYGLSMDKLKNLLSKFGEVMEVGASFGILMVKGYDIDFALPRTENSTGSKHTDFEVAVSSDLNIEDATKRRDFTMNAILQEVLTGKYIDLYGGIEDIKNKKIRYVDKTTFKEDELRIFRACQFASRFNFTIDEEVKEVAKTFNFKTLSKERIFEELNKALLKSEKPSIAFNSLFEMGVIEKLFPELHALKGCTQSETHHPEGDVWNHTMMVLDECSRLKNEAKNPLNLMYAALCHDLGKPDTWESREEGKITFHTHEEVGIPLAEQFMRRLTNEAQLINYVKNMTEYHMLGHKIMEVKDSTLRKLFTKIDISELMLFAEADELGRGREESFDYTPVKTANVERVNSLSRGSFGKIEPYFNGSDLIAMGYTQGEMLGKALKEAYMSQLNGLDKENIESMLKNKISPRGKPNNTATIVDIELSNFIKNDKKALESAVKRVEYFKHLEFLEGKDVLKFKRSVNKIPYVEIISEDRKNKYLFTPLFIMALSLNNEHKKTIFTTFDNNIEERLNIFNQVLSKIDGKKALKLTFMEDVYSRLPNKSFTS